MQLLVTVFMPGHEAPETEHVLAEFLNTLCGNCYIYKEEQQWPSDQAERQKQAQETTEYCDIPVEFNFKSSSGTVFAW